MANKPGFGKVVFTVIVLALAAFFFLRETDYCDRTRKLDELALDAAKKAGVEAEENALYAKEETIKAGRCTFLRIERHFMVRADFKGEGFLKDVQEGLKQTRFKLNKYAFEKKGSGETLSFSFSLKNRDLYEIVFSKEKYALPASGGQRSGRIAIVLDDFGYNADNLEVIFSIKVPLTLSVLPNLPYSNAVAVRAHDCDMEVILHMPMEPHNKELRLEEGTIMLDMTADDISGLLTEAIDSVPGAKGISNHMGSRATEDRDLMKIIFSELKKRDIYFLDSLVTDKSTCAEIAKEAGVRYASRRIFLDNISDEDYIEKQVFQMADLASKVGWAIGIGHDREATVKVLTRVIPQLKEAGFKFVYVSELVN